VTANPLISRRRFFFTWRETQNACCGIVQTRQLSLLGSGNADRLLLAEVVPKATRECRDERLGLAFGRQRTSREVACSVLPFATLTDWFSQSKQSGWVTKFNCQLVSWNLRLQFKAVSAPTNFFDDETETAQEPSGGGPHRRLPLGFRPQTAYLVGIALKNIGCASTEENSRHQNTRDKDRDNCT
jgi:hypothetical protein